MKIVVAYIPEHFSTPLFLAEKHGFYAKHGVEVEFEAYPSGSGHMLESLGEPTNPVNVTVGLTEAFIRAIAAGADGFKLVGIYVQSPLCWAVSTGANRDISSVNELEGGVIGVSRMGSGSDVMSKVLQQERKWQKPFEYVINNDFKNLRDGVNHSGSAHPSDAFMWEHFTSKKYYDSGEIKRIGEIYTPWPSWVISARDSVIEEKKALQAFLAAVIEGIEYFNTHQDEGIEWITSNLDYTVEDARSWLQTVEFSNDVTKVPESVVAKTLEVLQTAAKLPEDAASRKYVSE